MSYLYDDENERDAPEVWNLIRNNDPSVAHLILAPTDDPAPSFYQNLAEALQYNTNIKHLRINNINLIECIPNDIFLPIFESSNYIETLDIHTTRYDRCNDIHDDIFRSFVKSKNNKITKLKIYLTKECAELLTTFLSANMDNQMLKLILQRTIGTEAARKISDELFPTNSVKELELCDSECSPFSISAPGALLEAIGNNRSLEYLDINLHPANHRNFNFKLAIALEKILSNNKALKKLDLKIDKIDLQDFKTILRAIQESPSLESFLLDTHLDTFFLNTENIEDRIKKWCAKNSKKLFLTMHLEYLHIQTYGYSTNNHSLTL